MATQLSWADLAVPGLSYGSAADAKKISSLAAKQTGVPYSYTGGSNGFTVQPQYTNANNVPVQNAAQAQAPVSSGRDPHINPNTGQWDDNYFAQNNQPNIDAQQEALRNEISSGWDQYINSLGGLNSGIQDQRTAQENILSSQLSTGQNQIEGQRTSSLRDVAGNISNAFQAGNNFLGLRGAGDSSAANQYQFALTKEAAKQSTAVNEYTNTQLNQLQAAYDQGMQQVGIWFANAQNEVKQLIANGQLNKSQDIANLSRDILNNALQRKAQVEQNAQARYNALVEWATNNSQNIGQLTQNIASIPQALGQPTVDSRGNLFQSSAFTGFGGGSDNQDQNRNNGFNFSWSS